MRTTRALAALFAVVALPLLACGSSKEEDLFPSSGSSSPGGGTGTPATLTCGKQTCAAGQLCAIVSGISSCRAIPDACKSSPTCTCVDDHLECKTSFTCTQTNGQITWQCQ